MDVESILTYAELFIDKAKQAYACGDRYGEEQALVDLRKFLFDQPELEAGGAITPRQESEDLENEPD